MTAKTVKLLPAAEQDLENIWDYSVENWGEEKAGQYLDSQFAAFDLIAINPAIGLEYHEFTPSVRIHQHLSHLIIYLEGETEIVIVRVLHKNALLGQHVL